MILFFFLENRRLFKSDKNKNKIECVECVQLVIYLDLVLTKRDGIHFKTILTKFDFFFQKRHNLHTVN